MIKKQRPVVASLIVRVDQTKLNFCERKRNSAGTKR